MAVLNRRRHSRAASCGSIRGLLGLLLLALAAPAAAQPAMEYQIKAVFLFHFAQFVEWPASAFAAPDAPLIIGVLGEDPFGTFLDETVREEYVRGRPLVVRRYARAEDAIAAHILFVSRSERERLGAILQTLRGQDVLTVSDIERFTRHGGAIQFLTDQNKVRFRINVEAARTGQRKISAKLLRLAEIDRG